MVCSTAVLFAAVQYHRFGMQAWYTFTTKVRPFIYAKASLSDSYFLLQIRFQKKQLMNGQNWSTRQYLQRKLGGNILVSTHSIDK
jgi:hypothetical protein